MGGGIVANAVATCVSVAEEGIFFAFFILTCSEIIFIFLLFSFSFFFISFFHFLFLGGGKYCS